MKRAGKFVEVDDEGVRFAVVRQAAEGRSASGDGREAVQPSLRHFGADRLRREAVEVAGSLPDAVARDTRTVEVRSYDSITLELTGGRTVLWGSGEQGAAKAKSLTALMKARQRMLSTST